MPGLDEPLDLEGDDRLGDRGAADAEPGGEVALGGQPAAGGEAGLLGVGAQPVDDLLVEPTLGDRSQCVAHGGLLALSPLSVVPRPLTRESLGRKVPR